MMNERGRAQEECCVRVYIVSGDDSVHKLLDRYFEAAPGKIEPIRMDSVRQLDGVKVTPADVVFIDGSNGVTASDLGRKGIARRVKRAYSIGLCDADSRDAFQNLVLDDMLKDYFVVRPSFDTAYLRVQIRRAIQTVSGIAMRNDEETLGQPGGVLPGTTGNGLPKVYSGKTALVIEPDPSSLYFMRDLLQLEGFKVFSGSSVMNACARHRNRALDLLIMEIVETGVTGVEAVRSIKSQIRSRPPIIVTTAYSDRNVVEACVKEGVRAFVVKPARRKVIVEKIGHVVPPLST